MMSMQIPELLIPAGTLKKLEVALAYGADAVYAGVANFSMRPQSASFTEEDLRTAVALVHAQGKKIYIGINSLIMQEELVSLREWLQQTADIPFDAIIIGDPAVMVLVREIRPDVEIHISTQMSTANALAAKFWKQYGAKRVILARECSLADAKAIALDSGIPIEIFVHGAMCMAVSGRCLLSAFMTGYSASRGQCKHTCRWDWQLVEAQRPGQVIPVFETGKEMVFLGSADLCLLEHIPEIVQSGVASVKVEGRMKGEYYVAAITRAYRAALDAYQANPQNWKIDPSWLEDVNSVSHLEYSTGFAFGYPKDNRLSLQAKYHKNENYLYAGIVETVEQDANTVLIKYPFRIGDTLEWIGPGHTGGEIQVRSMTAEDGEPVEQSNPGATIRISFGPDNALLPLSILRLRKKEKVASFQQNTVNS